MSTSPAAQIWASYIRAMKQHYGGSQAEFGARIGYDQTAVSRWLRGVKPPKEAWRLAEIAQRLGRNPLEAFVAAGMLTIKQARSAIDEDSARLLASILEQEAGTAPDDEASGEQTA